MTTLRFTLSAPPPSVNSSTKPTGGGSQLTIINGQFAINRKAAGKRNSKDYKAWIKLAGQELMTQRGKLPALCYWRIDIGIPRALTKADIGNLEKAIPDLLVDHRRVPDDRYCVDTRTRFIAGDKVLIDVEKCDLENWLQIMRPGKDLEKRLRAADA